jgi:hypothetical protein
VLAAVEILNHIRNDLGSDGFDRLANDLETLPIALPGIFDSAQPYAFCYR